jgi:hypothetical protein
MFISEVSRPTVTIFGMLMLVMLYMSVWHICHLTFASFSWLNDCTTVCCFIYN